MNRRRFLAGTAGLGAAVLSSSLPRSLAAEAPQPLSVVGRSIDVDGRAASVFGLVRPDGGQGLVLDAGTRFAVALDNRLAAPTLIHWHGLTPPWDQDGVPDVPRPMLAPGESRAYDFAVGDGGTFWMHAHTLQEQNLLAAPLIVRRAADRTADEQEVVILLHDFSFRSAEEILAGLREPKAGGGHGHGGADTGAMPMHGSDMGAAMHGGGAAGGHAMGAMSGGAMSGGAMADHMAGQGGMAGHTSGAGMPGADTGRMNHDLSQTGGMTMDLNDIDYDAYLANDRTLGDPQVTRVERGGRVRLRIINGATSTAFTLDTGGLEASLIEVDGQPIAPIVGRRFPMTMGQRIDLRLTIPKEGGSFPMLVLREGAVERTGIVLATAGAEVKKIAPIGTVKGPVLDLALEAGLVAARPLAVKTADRIHSVDLTGDMAAYSWAMSAAALKVAKGERVEVTMRNASMMAHPMHLHGHHFQVVAIDGRRFSGAVRDTVLVPPMRSVTIAFDAGNPGRWAFHCHHLYHMATGMMAFVAYDGVV